MDLDLKLETCRCDQSITCSSVIPSNLAFSSLSLNSSEEIDTKIKYVHFKKMFTHGQIDDVRHSNVLCDSFLPRQPLVFPQPLLSLHLVGGGCRGGDGVAAVIAVPPGPVVLMRRVERGRRTGV